MRFPGALGPTSVLGKPGALRATLVVLAVPQVAIGIWALASPRGWFDNFPGGGNHWLPLYGAFDEHLVVDVGSAFLALGALLLLAAALLERVLVLAASLSYLVYQVPHFVYHLGADDRLSSGDEILNGVLLAIAIAAAAGIAWVSRADTAWVGPSSRQ